MDISLPFYYPNAIELEDTPGFPIFHFGDELKELLPRVNWTIIGKPPAMLDYHVAQIYNKKTKAFNQQVERNREYFLQEWCFRPTLPEWNAVKYLLESKLPNCHSIGNILGPPCKSNVAPLFFTEEGIDMAAFFQKTAMAKKRAIMIVQHFQHFKNRTGLSAMLPSSASLANISHLPEKISHMIMQTMRPLLAELSDNLVEKIRQAVLDICSLPKQTPQISDKEHFQEAYDLAERIAQIFHLSEARKQAYLAALLQDRKLRLPEEVLLYEGPRYFTLTEIASDLGVFSRSGKPHAQVIGAIIKKLGLDTEEFSHLFRFDRHGHQDVAPRYIDGVVPRVREWLEEQNWPETIQLNSGNRKKSFQVQYRSVHEEG